jgi:transglutaminase-like putative cysteine protease
MSSRPNLAALQASKPKPNAPPASCLACRDFTGPDEHAKRFPKESIPYIDPAWLGRELTAPFDSHTDKARAIFTWLHFNIDYDVVGFHNKGNRPIKTAADTIASGVAVCSGYSDLFETMATAGGLEAIVVGGHGKGV